MAQGRLGIALVSDWYPPAVGGVETQVRGLARALAADGHDVRVITSSRGEDEADSVHVERLECAYLPRTRVATPTRATYDELCERLARGRVDVVHAHGMFSTLAMGGLLAARRLGLASVTTHHSLLRLHHLPAARLVYLLASRHADVVTAVSHAAASDARRAAGRDEVLTLPNGIDVDGAGLRGAARSADGEIRVTSVMRLKLKKRPYHLVWDFARVLARVADRERVRLTIVGDGPERRRVERLAAWLGIRDRVKFCGECTPEDVAQILSDSTVFVSTARAEAFGIALLEARLAGLPIVALAGGGVADVVEHGRHGLLAPSRRVFVESVARVIEDASLRQRLADASRDGLERFSWDALAGRYLDVYRLAMERRRQRKGQAAT
jgi:glycosyltransferase involved in cell wall biosynthesis